MPRIKKRKTALFIVITLAVVGFFLVFTGQYHLSGTVYNGNVPEVWGIGAQPPDRRVSLNIQSQSHSNGKHHEMFVNQVDQHAQRSMKSGALHHDLPPRNIEELSNNAVPNIVFYMWCGNKTFEYKHYLSVQSVWRYIEPEVMEIHYKYEPKQDKYNDWLEELKSSIPNLALKQMPNWLKCDSCNDSIRDFLHDSGGLYVSEDTIILNSLNGLRKDSLTVFFDDENNPKLILSSPQNPKLGDRSCFSKSDVIKRKVSQNDIQIRKCDNVTDLPSNKPRTIKDCAFLSRPVFPKDILTANDSMAADLREIAYGLKEPIVPAKDEIRIPKIVHYIWYNRANMTFIMYLSLLSSLHVVKADRIFIHGGKYLEGHYWEKVKVTPKVQIVERETARDIFGNHVLYTHHKSDVIRADILHKYGGIYVDWDVIWLKPIDDLISAGYDVIVNFDHMPRNHFPDSINMGVVLSKPRAKYIELWRQTYRKYRPHDFFYNPIEVPYKIYERFPSLVKIEPRLQVMCYHLRCHPIFHPDYKRFEESQPFDWRMDVYSIHFTYPDPKEYKSEEALKNGQGMFAEIGKYILKSSGD